MVISKPTLPSKAGYVEVSLADGRRTYENIITGKLIEEEVNDVPLKDVVSSLQSENLLFKQQIATLSDQNDFQEELIVELANIVYA